MQFFIIPNKIYVSHELLFKTNLQIKLRTRFCQQI